MKLKSIIAVGTTALLALIGAVQAARWACSLTAAALAYWGGWAFAEAAQAAPWVLLALAGGRALSLWGMHKDNEYYKASGYGKIARDHARSPEQPEEERKGA